MIVPSSDQIGMTVFYQKSYMKWPEYGTIISVSPSVVRVRFKGEGSTKPCYPNDLFWPPDYCARDGANIKGQLFSTKSKYYG